MQAQAMKNTTATMQTILPAVRPSQSRDSRVQITAAEADFYRDHGYLVVENALSPFEVDALRQETVRICRGQLGHVRGLPPVFPEDSDEDVTRRTICVHFPHKISEVMYDFLAHPT